jgi:hypothetical protein
MLTTQRMERRELAYAVANLNEVVREVELDMEVMSGEGQKFRMDSTTSHKLTWSRESTDSNTEWTIKLNMSTDIFWCMGMDDVCEHRRAFEPARFAQTPSQKRNHSVWIPNFGDPDLIEE